MTESVEAEGRVSVPQTPSASVAPEMPDAAAMTTEIRTDRRHERFLLRAALIAALAVAVVIAVRLWT